jgi:hypothetical protein
MQKRDKNGRFLSKPTKQKLKHCKAKKVAKKVNKKSIDNWHEEFSPKIPKGKTVAKYKKTKPKPHPKSYSVKNKQVEVQKANGARLSEFTVFDLQDMIQAEVQFQMKELW